MSTITITVTPVGPPAGKRWWPPGTTVGRTAAPLRVAFLRILLPSGSPGSVLCFLRGLMTVGSVVEGGAVGGGRFTPTRGVVAAPVVVVATRPGGSGSYLL